VHECFIGARDEILSLVEEKLKSCDILRSKQKEAWQWIADQLPSAKHAYYYASTWKSGHIRQVIGCSGLPAEADIILLLPKCKNRRTPEGRKWFLREEVKEGFEMISLAKLKTHLCFVEKVGSKYQLLLIVVPPNKQGHALSC
jgi:hypothetical protein